MRVTAFHAADGDCVLVTSTAAPARRILVDGGRKGSYEDNTRDFLGQLQAANEKLDIVCVSHIDDDHISGILRLVEDEVEWRAFEFRQATVGAGNPPAIARPPEIGEVWHNGLFRLVGDVIGTEPEIVLSNVATVLAGSPSEDVRDRASELDDLATGELSSMELSRRLSTEQLGIALNPRTGGALVKRSASGAFAPGEQVTLGALTIFLLGPSDDDIDKLRQKWEGFIRDSEGALKTLHEEMLDDERRLGTLSPDIVANPLLDQALGEGLNKVTAANLASIMLLVEEDGASVLLTGDGVSTEILDGLARHDKLDANGRIHVDVLKVQHHGALANVETKFVKQVTADHYIFCGNGNHKNPEVEVVQAFANARLTGIDGDPPVGPAAPFKFWFTSSPETPDTTATESRQKHMKKVSDAVAALRQGHEARMTAEFIKDGHLEFDV
jgi:beta-lactamase superfamily II metal-dependent hydrolase